MKEIISFGSTLIIVSCSALANTSSNDWKIIFYLSCTLLAAILANYIVNISHGKIAAFLSHYPYLTFLFGITLAVFPIVFFSIYNFYNKEMQSFPYVILWTLFAAIFANYLLSKLPASNKKKTNSFSKR